MSLNTKYTNAFGEQITHQQKDNLTEHFELKYQDNNELKIKIHYFGNIINEGSYFMSPDEDLLTVIGTLDSSHRWGVMNDHQVINGYDVWRKNYYRDNELSMLYSKIVFKSDGTELASIGYDSNNQPRGGSKKFDLSNKNMISEGEIEGVFDKGDYVLFGFGSDGSFYAHTNTEMFYKPYNNLSQFIEGQEDGYIFNLMTPDMINYFTSMLPLVPDFQL